MAAFADVMRSLPIGSVSCSSDLKFHILDADFFARLFVVIKPVAFSQVNGGKFGVSLQTCGLPFALPTVSIRKQRRFSGVM